MVAIRASLSSLFHSSSTTSFRRWYSAPNRLVDKYLRGIEAHGLTRDERQIQLLGKLAAFSDELETVAAVETPDLTRRTEGEGREPRPPKGKILEDSGRQAGIYIYGGVGTGKSFCMDLFFNHASPRRGKKRWHFHEFMLATHERLHALKMCEEAVSDPLAAVARDIADESGALLCFDEFQVTDIGDAMILKRLLETIFSEGTNVIFTSNRPPKDLYLNGLNRHLFLPCISMLEQKTLQFDLGNGVDYRAAKQSSSGLSEELFLGPMNRDEVKSRVHQWMRDIYLKLGGEGEGVISSSKISVAMGRDLHLTQAIDGYTCSVTFSELCEKEKSAHDFLALAKSFYGVVITEMPSIESMPPDTLRRFITLIDALYEARCLVAISSDLHVGQVLDVKNFRASDPNQGSASSVTLKVLGEGGSSGRSTTMFGDAEWSATGRKSASLAGLTGAAETDFAKARAVSRLMEMLSEDWYRAARLQIGGR